MSNSFVQVPPDSTGKQVATNVVSGKEYQVINIADSAGNPIDDTNPLSISGAQADGAASSGVALVVAGVTAGGVVQILETNGSGHLHIADGGGSITVDVNSLPLPTGATTQSLQQEIRDLSDSINTLVQFLYANSPRIDVAGRMTVNNSELTQAVSGTVTATVGNATIASGTLTNLTNISGQPQQYVGQDVPIHLYDNIKVT
jgi:hypothetical protein